MNYQTSASLGAAFAQAPLFVLTILLASLAVFVLRAQPKTGVNQWFAASALSAAGWSLGIAWSLSTPSVEYPLRFAFASSSLIPAAFLSFSHYYPRGAGQTLAHSHRVFIIFGILFAVLSLCTPLIVYDVQLAQDGLFRKTGILYLPFALYCLAAFGAGIFILLRRWLNASGLARIQLSYFLIGALLAITGGLTTNLLLPLFTGRSEYVFFGPLFSLFFLLLVMHAIIRHRLMDLRLVIHRSLTIATASLLSLAPVCLLLFVFRKQIWGQLHPRELVVLLASIVAASLLVPPIRNIAGRLLDRYVYRTHANFRHTIRVSSKRFTQLLDLSDLLLFITDAVASSTHSEGVSIYLRQDSRFTRKQLGFGHSAAIFRAPELAAQSIVEDLQEKKDLLLEDELSRESAPNTEQLRAELTRLNWALVLPLLSEDTVIGFIALGPKLSGDPFYAQDLDLLMTLANQAGIAVKNAQLYTQVVLANEYIESILRTIESGVVAVDEAGRVAMFNRAAEQLTGLPAAQVQHQPVDLLPPSLATLLRGTVADGRERTEPEIALPHGESTRPVLCTTSPLRDRGGAVLGAVAVFSDLTPFKQLESERRRAERLAYFEILAASLAHEIRNPLVAIKAFAQLVPLRHRDEHFVAEFSRQVTRETARMERLVERLSALSQPSDRPRQPLDLREAIRQAVELMRPAFEEKRIAIASDLGPVPRPVLGDPHELEQLFLNLLMNAHEATPPGGAVVVGLAASDASVAVTVADSGPGFPPALLEHVFDPFITTKPRGAGLGLSICAGIAAAHRAKLRATNRPNGGALLTVEFPVSAPAESPRESSRSG